MIVLGNLFGVAAIGCAAIAVMNMLSAISFPEDRSDEAWPYAKNAYVFLALSILFMVISGVLLTN